MKNHFYLFTALLLLLGACELFTKDARPALPPATMEGKGTFGCLVNGKVFVNERVGFFGGGGTYAQMPNKNWLVIYADGRDSGMFLSLYDTTGVATSKMYILSSNTVYFAEYNTRLENRTCFYKREHLLTGKVQITKLDLQRSILSGTFEFTTYNPDCGDTVKITDGRFDIGEIIQ